MSLRIIEGKAILTMAGLGINGYNAKDSKFIEVFKSANRMINELD